MDVTFVLKAILLEVEFSLYFISHFTGISNFVLSFAGFSQLVSPFLPFVVIVNLT